MSFQVTMCGIEYIFVLLYFDRLLQDKKNSPTPPLFTSGVLIKLLHGAICSVLSGVL
jgi:hypothetical protein